MKKILLSFAIVFVSMITSAQSLTITGVVKDTKGEPVIGAAVLVVGYESGGVMTDDSGKFALSVPSSKSSLKVMCLSYVTKEVEICGKTRLDIVLEDDVQRLEDAVVVGYGAMRRSDLTGAITSVKIDETVSKVSTLDQMLEGKVAGVEIMSESEAPDAGVNIRVRGMSSFGTSMEPLYVVDGIIINGSSETIDMSISGDSGSKNTDVSNNGLSGINPKDIASIEILKDASATAIYGSQGANGVVLITTKSANRDKPTVTFSAGLSIATRDRSLDVLNLSEFVEYLEMRGNSTALETLQSMYDGYVSPTERGKLLVTEINWQDYLTRTALSQRYYLSVAGRPKGYNYFFSVGYNDTPGILKSTDSKTLTSRLNLEKKILKNLTLSVKMNVAYTRSNMANGSSAGGMIGGAQSILRSMLTTKPYISLDPDEEMPDVEDDETFQYGPNRWIQNYTNRTEKYRVQPSSVLQWKIVPWLSFKSTIGGDFNAVHRLQARTYKISKVGNCTSIAKKTDFKYNWDNLLLVNKKWSRHNLSATLGQSMSRDASDLKMNQGWYLEQAFGEEKSINSADPQYSYFNYYESASSLLSFFGRAIYNYDERYILTATYRVDGSSKFSGANKWGHFPSFAFAWRVVEEPWFNVSFISNLKLRAGWGRVGNQKIADYQTLNTYENNNYADHFGPVSDFVVGIIPSNIPNPDLKWESSEQVNLGLDLSLWRGRIAITVDAYDKNSIDLLQMKNIAHSSGFSQMAVNSGSVRNTGMEFSLDAIPYKDRHFLWQIGGNIGFNKNKITSTGAEGESGDIYLSKDQKVTARYFVGDKLSSMATEPLNIFIEGQPMGLFYGYLVEGVNNVGETSPFLDGTTRGEGYLRYADLNNDGKITSVDRTIIGSPLPKFTYGFNTSLEFYNIRLSIQAVGSYGSNIYNLNNMYDYYTGQASNNVRRKAVYEAWTPDNPTAMMPGFGKLSSLEQTSNTSLFVEDGSYLQIKNVSLSYLLEFRRKAAKIIRSVDFGLSCGNLYTFTKYSGWTPRTRNTALKKLGVDLNSYPGQRSFSFDVKLNF